MLLEGFGIFIKFNDLFGFRTRELSAFSAVPQSNAIPLVLHWSVITVINTFIRSAHKAAQIAQSIWRLALLPAGFRIRIPGTDKR